MNRTLLAFMLAVCSAVSAQPPSYVPSDGLVGWYPFDGNALDESGHLFHGTAQGAVLAEDRHGNASSAYHFDGQSHIDLGNFPELNPPYLSISVWFRQDSHNLVSGLSTILGRNLDDGPNRYGYNIGVFGGSSWELSPDEGLRYGFKSVVDSPPTDVDMGGSVPVSAWHHYVAVKDSVDQEIRFYLNGSIVGTQALEIGPTLALDAKTMIGIYRPNGAHAFTGYIDDVGIWNRALSPTEIQTLFTLTPLGCTNEQACNYDTSAIEDDGSCVYPPLIDLGEDIETCEDSVILDAGEGFGSYLWSTGETSQSITVSESGLYEATVSAHPANDGSLSFDGDGDWVSLAPIQSDVLEVGGAASVEMTYAGYGALFSATRSYAPHYPVIFRTEVYDLGDGTAAYIIYHRSSSLSVNESFMSDSFSYNGEAWNTVTVAIDNEIGRYTLYHNGQTFLDFDFEPASFSSPDLVWGIGNLVYNGGGTNYFSGFIDHVAVYDEYLTEADANDLFGCTLSLNPVHEWDFEEGQGEVAIDATGNENHGQLVGATWSDQTSSNPNCQSCESSDEILVDFDDCDGYCGEGTVWDETLETCVSVCSDTESGFGCDDTTACNYIPQGLSAAFYVDSLNYSIPFLLSQGFSPSGLVGLVYGGGVIYHWEEQDSLITLHIVHPPEYSDAPVPNMGLSIGSACGAGGEFGGNFFEAAVECEELVLEGYDDWSLPSIDQVEQVYQNLFYSSEYPLNVCATGAFGYFKGIDYLSSTETCRCYFGTGVTVCNSNALGAYEFFPVRDTSLVIDDSEFECEYGCHYCGDGTLWDDTLQECVSLTSEVICGEGTVWDPFNQECIVAIPTDTDFDGCVTAGDVLNLLATFGTCPPILFSGPCQGQDHVTYQGYDYDIVAIGEQCWFAENARFLPEVSPAEIGSEQDGLPHAYVYGWNNESVVGALESSSYIDYGALYNFEAVQSWALCPSGWHVPTHIEWIEIIEYLGGATVAGVQMKADYGWSQDGNGSNSSGFTALPAGTRYGTSAYFNNVGINGFWWSSTSSSPYPWSYYTACCDDEVQITNFDYNAHWGLSVRCIKDQ